MTEQKGCCSSFQKLFGKIDYFGVTFLFRINKSDKYGSSTGGFCFLLYCIFALGFIVLTLIEWDSGTKINVYTI